MIELIQIAFINILAKLLKFSFEIGTNYFVDKETYGYFAILLSYILIYSRIVTLGIPNVLLREFPKKNNLDYHSSLLLNSTIVILAITIMTYSLIYLLDIKYLSYYKEVPIIAISTALLAIYSTYLRSQGYIKLWIFMQDISWYVYYFIGLLFLYYMNQKILDISLILKTYSYSIVVSLVTVILLLRFKYHLKFIFKSSFKKIKYIYTHSFPVLFTGLTYLILARIDVIMLSDYVDIELVGEYNIIARITIQVLFFHQVITAYFYPRLAKKFASKENHETITTYITKYMFLSFLSVLFISSILFVFIRYFNLFDILKIINQDELFTVFVIFALTQIIYSGMSFYGYILLYIHKQKIEYLNNVIILVIGIILNVILIPIYGVVGAALASAIAIIMGSLLEMFEVKYFTNTFFIKLINWKNK